MLHVSTRAVQHIIRVKLSTVIEYYRYETLYFVNITKEPYLRLFLRYLSFRRRHRSAKTVGVLFLNKVI